MHIYQIISTIAYGDAVSNDAIALQQVIKRMGIKTHIYAESIVPPYDFRTALPIAKLKKFSEDDIIIYHASTGTQINYDIVKYPCRKIMIYHNITPPEFFEGYDEHIKNVNAWGLEGIKFLNDKMDYCIADSEYNKQELIKMGYTCPIDVLPIVIPMKDYEKRADKRVIRDYNNGYTNIVFTGRLAPNKKQEDIIAAFYYYKRLYNPKSRLFLVGNYKPTDIYYQKLVAYIKRLGINEVYITGHIKFNSILAYYKIADLLLCMSEHEGFCVPLVEAMIFECPIVAYNSTAIASTLGEGGLLIDEKSPLFVAGCMDKVINDAQIKGKIIQKQKEQLKSFEYETIAKKFEEYLKAFISKG